MSAGAFGVIVLGAVPMAAAQAAPAASTILAQSIDGGGSPIDLPAPGFSLTGQDGRPVSLAGLRGKVVLLTFLDPVCVTDCPLIAQEFRQASRLLRADRGRVELVAIDVNPLYSGVAYTQAFDRQENLAGVASWRYLTGSPARLRQVYRAYGIPAQTLPAGAMLGHPDIVFVIDAHGTMRQELDFDPGPGTAATEASFAPAAAGGCCGPRRTSPPTARSSWPRPAGPARPARRWWRGCGPAWTWGSPRSHSPLTSAGAGRPGWAWC